MSLQLVIATLLAEDTPEACREIVHELSEMLTAMRAAWSGSEPEAFRLQGQEIEEILFAAGADLGGGSDIEALDKLRDAYGKLGALKNATAVRSFVQPQSDG